MRHLATRALAVVVAVASIACSQTPITPSSGGETVTSVMATVVDVPLSVDVTEGLVGTWNYVGQSVTMPPGAGFGNLRFAWYHYNPRGQTTAFGRVYVLDREFLGAPSAISPSMPGFLARSEPEASGATDKQGSEYTLPDSLVLAGSTRYWFYSDTKGAFAQSFDKDSYADGNVYMAGVSTIPFQKKAAAGHYDKDVWVPPPPNVTIDANFRLRGIAR